MKGLYILLFIIFFSIPSNSEDLKDEKNDTFDQSVLVKVQKSLMDYTLNKNVSAIHEANASIFDEMDIPRDIEIADINDFPFHVVIINHALVERLDANKTLKNYTKTKLCFGTLIDPVWILTAARCLSPKDHDTIIKVLIKSLPDYSNDTIYRVDKRVFNVDRARTKAVMDVALLRLTTAVKDIIPAELPRADPHHATDKDLNYYVNVNLVTLGYEYADLFSPAERRYGPVVMVNYTVKNVEKCIEFMKGIEKNSSAMYFKYSRLYPALKQHAMTPLPEPKRGKPFIPRFDKYKMLCVESKKDRLTLSSELDIGSGFFQRHTFMYQTESGEWKTDQVYRVLGVLHGPFKTRTMMFDDSGQLKLDFDLIETKVPQIVIRVPRYVNWINNVMDKFTESNMGKVTRSLRRKIFGTTERPRYSTTRKRRHSHSNFQNKEQHPQRRTHTL